MTMEISSPVTGAAQTGFTSPTYTLSSDVAPSHNALQWAVTALGGTQTGVEAHSVSNPFTVTCVRPKSLATLGFPGQNGFYSNIRRNEYNVITRKGVTPAADQPSIPMAIKTQIPVPAGADTYDPESIRAALSLHIGALEQIASDIGDTAVSGII